jgi:hypothetical protein
VAGLRWQMKQLSSGMQRLLYETGVGAGTARARSAAAMMPQRAAEVTSDHAVDHAELDRNAEPATVRIRADLSVISATAR